jgi:hypothetical protein
MDRPRAWFVGAVSAIVLSLAAIAAIGAGGRLGEGSSRQVAATFEIDPMQVVSWVFLGMIGILLLAAFSGRGGQQRQKRQRRNVSQAGVFLFLVIFSAVALTIASIGDDEDESGGAALPGEGSLLTLPGQQVVGTAGGLLAVAVLGTAAVALWLHASRRSPHLDESAGPVERVIDEALLELESGGDPRQVIIRAYARLERTFESGGMDRRPEEAPQEYVGRVLGMIDIDPRAVRALTELYEEARYSTHRITEQLALDARAVLGTIRSDLASA